MSKSEVGERASRGDLSRGLVGKQVQNSCGAPRRAEAQMHKVSWQPTWMCVGEEAADREDVLSPTLGTQAADPAI